MSLPNLFYFPLKQPRRCLTYLSKNSKPFHYNWTSLQNFLHCFHQTNLHFRKQFLMLTGTLEGVRFCDMLSDTFKCLRSLRSWSPEFLYQHFYAGKPARSKNVIHSSNMTSRPVKVPFFSPLNFWLHICKKRKQHREPFSCLDK